MKNKFLMLLITSLIVISCSDTNDIENYNFSYQLNNKNTWVYDVYNNGIKVSKETFKIEFYKDSIINNASRSLYKFTTSVSEGITYSWIAYNFEQGINCKSTISFQPFFYNLNIPVNMWYYIHSNSKTNKQYSTSKDELVTIFLNGSLINGKFSHNLNIDYTFIKDTIFSINDKNFETIKIQADLSYNETIVEPIDITYENGSRVRNQLYQRYYFYFANSIGLVISENNNIRKQLVEF